MEEQKGLAKSDSSKTITAESQSEADQLLSRQRSISLPSHADFPSPSSSFLPPPGDETQILQNLLARDRTKRDKMSKFKFLSKRSTSVGELQSSVKSPAHARTASQDSTKLSKRTSCKEQDESIDSEPSAGLIPCINKQEAFQDSVNDSNAARRSRQASGSSVTTDSTASVSGYETPRTDPALVEDQMTPTSLADAFEQSQNKVTDPKTPSRPASSYIQFLPDLDTSSSEIARRLSVSTSKRHSKMSVSSSSSQSSTIPNNRASTDAITVSADSPSLLQTASIYEIKIRDFAFQSADPLHIGQPQDLSSADLLSPQGAAKASLRWNPRIGSLPEGVFDDSSSDGGMSSSRRLSNSASSQSPYKWDFQLVDSPSNPSPKTSTSSTELSFPNESTSSDIPLDGALYLAMYEFVAEASQEMGLKEGEVVRVLERLCEGWVVASRTGQQTRLEEEETGICPEAFLRKIEDSDAEAAGQSFNDRSYLQAMSQLHIATSTPPISPR